MKKKKKQFNGKKRIQLQVEVLNLLLCLLMEILCMLLQDTHLLKNKYKKMRENHSLS